MLRAILRALLTLLQGWGFIGGSETDARIEEVVTEHVPVTFEGQQQGRTTNIADVLTLMASLDHANESLQLISTCTGFWTDALLKRITLNHAYGTEGKTKAMLLCIHGKNYPPPRAEDELRKLLQSEICDVNMQTLRSRNTALHFAVLSAQPALVQLLVSCPTIDPNLTNWSDEIDNGGETPLILAAKRQNIKIVKILLQCPAIDPNKTDAGGRCALFWAIGTSNTAVVKRLLSSSNIDPNVANKRGENSLSFASERGYNTIVDCLLEHPRIDINTATGQQGATPLMIAASNGWTELVRTLCQDARCEINKEAVNNWTAMTFAASPEISQILAEHGGV